MVYEDNSARLLRATQEENEVLLRRFELFKSYICNLAEVYGIDVHDLDQYTFEATMVTIVATAKRIKRDARSIAAHEAQQRQIETLTYQRQHLVVKLQEAENKLSVFREALRVIMGGPTEGVAS